MLREFLRDAKHGQGEMDSREFVEVITRVVRDDAIAGTLSILQQPPGRLPGEVTANSAWYHSLDEGQRARVSSIVRTAVDQAVFGFLCVLDGVRAIEDGETKGYLELRHIKEKASVLNPMDGPMLHDIY